MLNRTRLLLLGVMVLVALDACAGDAGDGEEAGAEAAAGSAGENETSGAAESDVGAADSTAGPEAILNDGASCELLADGFEFDVALANAGAEPVDVTGTVRFLANGSEVHSTSLLVTFVEPGQSVRERRRVGDPAGIEADTCVVEEVVQQPAFVLAGFEADDDVGGCEIVGREELFDSFAFEVTIANPSANLAVDYETHVAVIDPDGVRREVGVATTLGEQPVPPSQTVDVAGRTSNAEFAEGYRCEVLFAIKFLGTDFFTAKTPEGIAKGSLSADVGFSPGSAELTPDALLVLSTVIEGLATAESVCVEGFADSVGDTETNLTLSQARADAVADYIRANTVVSEIEAIGRGESEAAADEVDDPTLRRVDITQSPCSR